MVNRREPVQPKFSLKFFRAMNCAAVSLFVFSACSSRPVPANPIAGGVSPMQQVIVLKEPRPAGISEKCWQEPEVRLENEGPGLDPEGKWYRPAHQSIRMVKGGKWVDCSELGTDRPE